MQHDAGRERDEAIDPRRYWNVFRREKWLIVGCAVLVALLAATIAQVLTPVYSASATLLIEANHPKIVSIDEIYGLDARTQQYYETQFEILNSRPLAEAVIADLALLETAEYRPSSEPNRWSWRTYVPDFLAPAAAIDHGNPLYGALERYSDRLAIEPIVDTQLVRVHFESADPELAARVANAHAQAYIESMLDAKLAVTSEAASWMQKRLKEMQHALRESEAELQAFREREQLVDVDGARALPSAEINDVSTQLVEVRQLLAARENAYAQITLSGASGVALSGIPAILDDPSVRSSQDAFATAQQKVAELGKRYGPLHPTMIEALAERDLAKAKLDEERARVADRIRREYESAQAEERALLAGLARDDYQVVGRTESELSALQRAVDTNRDLYDLFYNRVSESAVTSDLQTAQARVIESALVPIAPVKPQKAMIIGGAFIVTMLLGLVVAFVGDGLNNTLRSAQDIEEKLHRAMLTMVPLLSARKLANVQGGVIEDSTYCESMRALRTSIVLDGSERRHKVVLVTSSINGEGKSTVALNLAAAFAKTGKVLIIDADMRRPTIGRLLDLPRYDAGLSELITRAAAFKSCLAKTKVPNLHVIRTGFIPNDPLELLAHRRLAKILRVLTQAYDHIVIDAPPILPASDAAVLSKYADSVVFVVKAESTPVPQIESGLRLLERVDAPISGVVLNQLDMRKAARYTDFGYGGYYETRSAQKA